MGLLKKALLTGTSIVTIAFSGCGPAPSQNASSIYKILKSDDGKTAVLSTEVMIPSYNPDLVNGTRLYLETNGNKNLFLETRDLITDIETGHLNNDGVEDFIVSYRRFHSVNRRLVVGTGSEVYLSTGKDFGYTKKQITL
jgi:hypothetical protein